MVLDNFIASKHAWRYNSCSFKPKLINFDKMKVLLSHLHCKKKMLYKHFNAYCLSVTLLCYPKPLDWIQSTKLRDLHKSLGGATAYQFLILPPPPPAPPPPHTHTHTHRRGLALEESKATICQCLLNRVISLFLNAEPLDWIQISTFILIPPYTQQYKHTQRLL